jgi:small ligand-binding sensory domain FIST
MHASPAVVAHWNGPFDDGALERWAAEARARLDAPRVSLGLVFITPALFPHAEQILEILRVRAQIPLLIGCSSSSLIVGDQEFENTVGLALSLYAFPNAELHATRFTQDHVTNCSDPAWWHRHTNVSPDQTGGWLVFADPFHLDSEQWLEQWNQAYAPIPILGGLASGPANQPVAQVYLNGDVFEDGAVAVSVGGQIRLASLISQGCTPIGQTWTITRAQQNLIHEIANRPAYQILSDTVQSLPPAEQQLARGNLFVGLVLDEYREHFGRGDFLIRNLLGFDPRSGSLAVGAFPRTGQTVQFQRRDPAAATEDLATLLAQTREQLAGTRVHGACLCACNGRGSNLFGQSHHDAQLIQQELGPIPLAGFFCNGEIGPVGNRNHLHGYTAALALFVDTPRPPSGE